MLHLIFTVLGWVLGPISLVVSLYCILHAFRYLVRHMVFMIRSRMFLHGDDLVWSRILPDDTDVERKGSYNAADALGLVTLHESISSKQWPRLSRGLVSYVLTRGQHGQIDLYIGVSQRHFQESIIRQCARSIGATFELVNDPPIITRDNVVISERSSSEVMGVQDVVSEVGTVMEGFATIFNDQSLDENGAVVITVETVPESERIRIKQFLTDQVVDQTGATGAFSSAGNKAGLATFQCVRASVVATGTDDRISENIANTVTSNMAHLLPTTFRWQHASRMRPTIGYLMAGAFAAALTIFVGALVSHLEGSVLLLSIVALGVSALCPIVVKMVNATSPVVFRKTLEKGYVEPSPYAWLSPRWWLFRNLRTLSPDSPDSNNRKSAYPSDDQMIYMQPLALLNFVSFPSGRTSTAVNVSRNKRPTRGVSNEALQVNGSKVFLGVSGTNQVICGSSGEVFTKPSISFGAMGSGKTNLIDVVFIGSVYANICPEIDLKVTSIWGETKGSGAYDLWNQVKDKVKGAMFIDVYNPSSRYRLALEGPRVGERYLNRVATAQDVKSNIAELVGGLQAAYGSSIGAESRQTLISSLTISALLSEEEVDYLGIRDLVPNPAKPNIVQMAYWIMRGEESIVDIGSRLLSLATALAADPDADERQRLLANEINRSAHYWDPQQKRQYDHLLNPPRNKMRDLLQSSALWDTHTGKTDIFVHQLPTAFRPIIINMGPPSGTNVELFQFNAENTRKMLACFHHLLWYQAKQQCQGWETQGKRVVVCYDEIADLAASASNISSDAPDSLGECLRQGRSLGFSPHIGGQYPESLPNQTRDATMSITNKNWFRLSSSSALRMAVDDLSYGDRDVRHYTASNVQQLPVGTAASVWELSRGVITAPFTLIVPEANVWARILLTPTPSGQTSIGLPTVEQAIQQYREEHDLMEQGYDPTEFMDTPQEDYDPRGRRGMAESSSTLSFRQYFC